MRDRYDLSATRYVCNRCKTVIDIESESFHWFAGEDDPNFWCQTCQDFPSARILGSPAEQLPTSLQLPRQFELLPVPRLEPADDVESSNLLYRPYTKRSFLCQYIDWLKIHGVEEVCQFQPSASCSKVFDPHSQRYTDKVEYRIIDECGHAQCKFLRTGCLRPVFPDEASCFVLRHLCDKTRGLCETGDEAQILQNYLLLTAEAHFPMLVPQVSILSGRRRADVVCFVPVTRFQYKPVAVLVDRPGKDTRTIDVENREYQSEGFSVRRLLVNRSDPNFSYFKAARELKNWIETDC